MMEESIDVVKQGVIVRSFNTEMYSLNLLNSLAVIQNKETRKVHCIISPAAYDYIEVNKNESDV